LCDARWREKALEETLGEESFWPAGGLEVTPEEETAPEEEERPDSQGAEDRDGG